MTDDVIEQAAKVAHDAVCGCGDLRTHNVEDYPINVSFGVVARALAAADLLVAPSAPSVHQRWRDEVRGQIRSAIHAGFCGCRHEHDNPNHTITTGSTDRVAHAIMAIVDPILAERNEARASVEHLKGDFGRVRAELDAQLRVRAAVEELLDEELGTEPTPETEGGYVANVRLMVARLRAERDQAQRGEKNAWENCHQTEDHLTELYEAAGIAPETLIEDAVTALGLLRWLHAEAVWQRQTDQLALSGEIDRLAAERDEARRELAAHVAMHHEHVQRGHQWMRRAETAEAELGAANAKLGPDEPTPSDLQVAPSLGATGTAGVRLMREGIERSRADAAAPSPPVDRETLLLVGAIALNGGDERHALDRWGEMVGCVLDALASAGVVAQQHVPTKPAESLEGAGHAPTELDGVALIAAERCRQVEAEGWTAEHDNQHISGELGYAAACYAMPDAVRWFDSWLPDGPSGETVHYHGLWPWHPTWWKPTPDDRVRELVKAGALIAADIDRLLRARDYSRAAGQP